MEKVFCRSEYNYDRDKVSEETGLNCKDLSLAKQSFADECDINNIVKRFGLTGQLPDNVRMPEYRDFDEVIDFHTAMNAVALARESFNQLSPEIRARFANDPALFVDFCMDDANIDEARKLGLVPAEELKEAPKGALAQSPLDVTVPGDTKG